jgi:hypothetical protein
MKPFAPASMAYGAYIPKRPDVNSWNGIGVNRYRFGQQSKNASDSSDSQEAKPHSKETKPLFKRVKALGTSILNCCVLTLAILGGAEVYNRVYGDGPLPRFAIDHGLTHTELDATKTLELSGRHLTPQEGWQGLQSSVEILNKVVPEVADWLKTLHQQGKIKFDLPAEDYKGQYEDSFIGAVSTHHTQSGNLNISQGFWEMSEWEKAGFIVHEYRHSRQNIVKTLKISALNAVTGHVREYSTGQIEAEAYLYEKAFYAVLQKEEPEEVALNLFRYALGDEDIRHIFSPPLKKDFGED